MTNQEAIKYLIRPFATSTRSYNEYLKQKEAYDLAIKVLEDKPQGEEKLYNFVSNPIEVVKVGEPIPNSDEINKALEKGELYKQGFEDAMRKFKRPQGNWIYKCCCGEGFPKCSICGEINDVTSNFCPDCGADMRGE